MEGHLITKRLFTTDSVDDTMYTTQSRQIGCKLVRHKGKRIFLDELPENAKGNKMKGIECGIFCETKI